MVVLRDDICVVNEYSSLDDGSGVWGEGMLSDVGAWT